jgi:gliding motility-associated-like protein
MRTLLLLIVILFIQPIVNSVKACDGLSVSVISNEYIGNDVYEITLEYCEYVTNGGQTQVTGILVQTDGANILGTSTPSFVSNSTGAVINYSLFNATTAEWGSWDNNPVQNPPFIDDGDPEQCITIVIQVDGPVNTLSIAGSSSPADDGDGFDFINGRYTCAINSSVPPAICSSNWTTPLFCEGDNTPINLNDYTSATGVFSGDGVDSGTGIFDPTGVSFPASVTFTVGDINFNCQTTLDINPINVQISGAVDQTVCEGETADIMVQSSGGVSSCEYTLNLFNSAGAGWTGGASIDVMLNGSTYGTYTISGSASSASFIIPVSTGDQITFSYNSGTNDGQNSVTMNDYQGTEVYNQGSLTGGGLPGTINVVCQDPGYTFEWTPSTYLSSDQGASVSSTPDETITYTVTLTNTDSGCQSSEDITITVTPTETPTFDPFPDVCQNSTPPVFPTTSNNGLNGTWSPEVTTENAGTFTYTFTPEPTGACPNQSISQDLTVLSEDDPLCAITCEAIANNNGPLCEGETLQLFGDSEDNGTYSWTGPNGFSSTEQNPIIENATADMQGEYTLTFTIEGCETTTSTEVVINTYPTASFTADTIAGEPPLEVDIINTSEGTITSYDWNFGNGVTSEDPFVSTTQTYNTPGNPTITLIVSNEGCNDTASVQLSIVVPPFDYNIPNVFTPNSDGNNDYFDLNLQNVAEVELIIFNRWGNIMAEITDVNSPGWDGKTPSGEEAAEGVYFHKYHIVGQDGNEVEGHGFLQLVRE